jgi:hypothetical protein
MVSRHRLDPAGVRRISGPLDRIETVRRTSKCPAWSTKCCLATGWASPLMFQKPGIPPFADEWLQGYTPSKHHWRCQ